MLLLVQIYKNNMKQKELITSGVFLVLLIVLYVLFPIGDEFQSICAALVFFVVLPILYIKIILKKQLRLFGIDKGKYRLGLMYATSGLFASMVIIFIFIKKTSFLSYYLLPTSVTKEFWPFLFYELTIVLLFVVIYEFFFRGFVYFTFEKNLKKWAIVVQMLLFYILIFSIGVSRWNFLPYMVFTPFAGIIVYKSKSIIYSIVAQWMTIVLLDTYVIHLIK
jgi:membrane protease YdiL (CAAX protease family)